MVGESRRAAIRKAYRLLRTASDKTQLEVEALARLDAGRYWKIENGITFPTDDERRALARVLRCDESELPTEDSEPTRVSA